MASAGKVRIGWTIAKVELLARRSLQCFRCWEYGHVRFARKASVDRSGHCFNCGGQGHFARGCKSEEIRCVICEDKGYQSNHRIGSKWCNSVKQMERGKQAKENKSRGRAIKGEVGKERYETKSERRTGQERMNEEKMEYYNDEL